VSKWTKGQSGNPGGRPRGLANSVKQRYGRKAFDTIVDIMEGRIDELAFDKDGHRFTVAASVKEIRESARIVLAYTWGTPVPMSTDELEKRIEEIEKLLAGKLKPGGQWPAH
jgi:hypothetical protein